jgi:hypothetical protein
MHEGLGRLERAAEVYEGAIARLEERRALLSRDELKTALTADSGVQYLYFQAVRAALRIALADEDAVRREAALARAFSLSEMARGRALLDLLAANLRMPRGDEPKELRRWRELTTQSQLWRGLLARARSAGGPGSLDRVEALEERIRSCETGLFEAARSLAATHPHLGALLAGEADTVSLAELMRLIPEDTALLQYMTLGEELLLWAVTRKGVAAPRLVEMKAAALASRVLEFQAQCAGGGPIQKVIGTGSELGRVLLDPFESVIEAHERLVFIPYGALHRLPFAA